MTEVQTGRSLRCTLCKDNLPEDAFALQRNTPRGRQYRCRQCSAKRLAAEMAKPGAREARHERTLARHAAQANGTEARLLCSRCKETLPLDAFAVARGTTRGRQYNCRPCQALRQAERAAEPGVREAQRERQRQQRATPAGRAAITAYRQASAERRKIWQAQWNAANPEKIKAQGEGWYAANKERKAAAGAAWIEANRDRRRDHYENRRARKEAAWVEDVDRTVVWERDGGVCHVCKLPAAPDNWHLDHVRPISKGGKHSYANTAVTHPACNIRKSASLSYVM